MTQLPAEIYEGDVVALYDSINSAVNSEISTTDELMNLNTLKEIEIQWLVDNKVEEHGIKWALVLHKFENVLSVHYDELERNIYNGETITFFIKLFAKFFSRCNLSLMYHPDLTNLNKVFNSNFNCFIRLGYYFARDLVVVRVGELVKRYICDGHMELNYLIVKSVDYLFKYGQYDLILELYRDYRITKFFESIDKYLLGRDSILTYYSQIANSLLNSRQYVESISLYKIIFNLPVEKASKDALTQLIALYNINLILLPIDHIYYTTNYNNKPLDSNLVKYSSLFVSSWIFQLVQSYHVYDYSSVEHTIKAQLSRQSDKLAEQQQDSKRHTRNNSSHNTASTTTANTNNGNEVILLNLDSVVYDDILSSLRFKKLLKSIQSYSSISLEKLSYYDPVPGTTKKDTLAFIGYCSDPEKFYLAHDLTDKWDVQQNGAEDDCNLILKVGPRNAESDDQRVSRNLLLHLNDRLVGDNRKLDEITNYVEGLLDSVTKRK